MTLNNALNKAKNFTKNLKEKSFLYATNVTSNKVLSAHDIKEAFDLESILNTIIRECMGY